MNEMYAENILDHYRNPRNFGTIVNAQVKHEETNPLCGDDYEFYLQIDNGKIQDAKFSGDGCAISKASASMLSEFIKQKDISELKKMNLVDVEKLLGVKISAPRVKCATLALVAVQKGIQEFEESGKK